MMKTLLVVLLLLPLVPITHAQQPIIVYEFADCQFPIPSGETVECGYLHVPENRTDPASPTLRLHVAYFHSHAENPPTDPIFYLFGGPGVSGLLEMENTFFHFSPYLENRDVIVIDQRGIGYSEPALACPEIEGDNLGRFMENCMDYWTERGFTPAHFTSAESAADLNDLRQVLGFEQVNLVGVSYGSRLALVTMRDFPEMIRSAVLDSVAPPHLNITDRSLFLNQEILNQLIADCAADSACSAAYPDLQTVFARVRTRRTGTDRTRLDQLVTQMLAATSTARQIPYVIYETDQGNRVEVDLDDDHLLFDGLYAAILCTDGDFMNSNRVVCQALGITRDDLDSNDPVRSPVPALVLNGAYDPTTPTAWAESAAQYLLNAYFFEIPYTSHGVVRSGDACPRQIAFDFLDDPTREPNRRCIDQMEPHFVIP